MTNDKTGPIITYTEVIKHLKNGVTRRKGDKGYNEERGSIEEKYAISKTDVNHLFKHPALIGKKVTIPKVDAFVFVDDRPIEEKKALEQVYGVPTAAAKKRIDAEAINNPKIESKSDAFETIEEVIVEKDIVALDSASGETF